MISCLFIKSHHISYNFSGDLVTQLLRLLLKNVEYQDSYGVIRYRMIRIIIQNFV